MNGKTLCRNIIVKMIIQCQYKIFNYFSMNGQIQNNCLNEGLRLYSVSLKSHCNIQHKCGSNIINREMKGYFEHSTSRNLSVVLSGHHKDSGHFHNSGVNSFHISEISYSLFIITQFPLKHSRPKLIQGPTISQLKTSRICLKPVA